MSAPNTPNTEERLVKRGVYVGPDGKKYDLFYNNKTGDYRIKSGDTILVNNNVFSRDALNDPNLFNGKNPSNPTDLANTLIKNSKTDILKASQSVNGKVHPSANVEGFSIEGTDENQENKVLEVLLNLPGVKDLANFIENIQFPDVGDYGTDMKALFINKKLKYPIDMNLTQDRLVITQYAYKAPYGDAFRLSGANNRIIQNGAQRESALRDLIGTVTLPIPNNVSDRNSTNWGNGEAMDTMAMSVFGNSITAAGVIGGAKLAELASSIPGLKNAAPLLNIISNNPQLAYTLLTGSANTPLLSAVISSFILQKLGYQDVTPQTILSRGYGVIPNSNVELLFSGPTLRGFSFGYLMTPRSSGEAATCRDILRFFKQGMAPKKKQTSSTGYGEASFFLATPNVFKLQYKTGGGEGSLIKGLNRFKICALTDMSANYAQDQWMAYEEGQPARIILTLNFKELEPVYESDYQPKASSELNPNSFPNSENRYLDQDPVNPDEIGY